MSNTDEERHEPTGTYANRGIPLPGLRPAHQQPGLEAAPIGHGLREGRLSHR
jgi:hypothetical protein